jgi:hypothetical protein
MKKLFKLSTIILSSLVICIQNANANETSESIGGFAIVNPETGVVHGIITGSIEYFGNNDKTMNSEYMGCPPGCKIIMQSTADQGGNVAGIHGPNVTYNENKNVYQSVENNVIQSQTVTEFSSNTSTIETEINTVRSKIVYEFGVQDFSNGNIQFQMTEVAPSQNTEAQITTITKELLCEDSLILCSSKINNSSNTLAEESINLQERLTSVQLEQKLIDEAKTKIREHVGLILNMLGKWVND